MTANNNLDNNLDKLIDINNPSNISNALATGNNLLHVLKTHNQNDLDSILDDENLAMQTCTALDGYDAAYRAVTIQLEAMTGYGVTQTPNPKCCNTYMRNMGYDENLNGDMFICDKCKRKKFYTHDEYYRMMADTYGRDIFGIFPEHLK